jgi:hypothetical protein
MDPVGWQSRGPPEVSVNWTEVGEIEGAVATARQSYPLSVACPAWAAS